MDLAMQSGDTLLLDHGTDILIWCIPCPASLPTYLEYRPGAARRR